MGTLEGWKTRRANEAARERIAIDAARRADRLRIRRELLEAARAAAWKENGLSNSAVLLLADLEDALDRICPEEE